MAATAKTHPLIGLLVEDIRVIGEFADNGLFLDAFKRIRTALGRLDKDDKENNKVFYEKITGIIQSIESVRGEFFPHSQTRTFKAGWAYWSSDIYDEFVSILWDGGYLAAKGYDGFFDISGGRKSWRRRPTVK